MLHRILSHCAVVLVLLPLLPGILSSRSASPSPTALLIVDMQRCFSSSGSLPVPGYASVLPVINRLRSLPLFAHVVLTQDWHPPHHISFVSEHSGMRPLDSLVLSYDAAGRVCDRPALGALSAACATAPSPAAAGTAAYRHVNQTLWPQHCVMDTADAAFHPELRVATADILIRKGLLPHVDAVSAFNDALLSPTALSALLSALAVRTVYVVGVALEVCVLFSALDARRLGYEVLLVRDATAGMGDGAEELRRLREAGVTVLHSSQVDGYQEAAEAEASGAAAAMAIQEDGQIAD